MYIYLQILDQFYYYMCFTKFTDFRAFDDQ